MRVLVAVVVICAVAVVARAEPPGEKAAMSVAARWYAAVERGDARAVATMTAPSMTFSFDVGGQVEAQAVRQPGSRAGVRRAVPRWRALLDVFPPAPRWSSQQAGDDWREVGFRTGDESFGELTVRVAHGRVVAVHGFWSWGGI